MNPETSKINPPLNHMGEQETSARLGYFLNQLTAVPGNGLPMVDGVVLRRLGLVNPNPEKSQVHQFVCTKERAMPCFSSLLGSGTFPDFFAHEVLDKAQQKIVEKRDKKQTRKQLYRGFKGFTKALSLLGQLGDDQTFGTYLISVTTMFGMWGLIDRITADPEERELARVVALAETLQQTYQLPLERQAVNPEKISRLTLDREPDQHTIELIREWQARIGGLLDKGVLPQTIFDLLRPKLHTPFRRTIGSAKAAIMENIITQLEALSPDKPNDNWSTEEGVMERRAKRQKLAENAALVDLLELWMPKITLKDLL